MSDPAPSSHSCRIIVVGNEKGGAGKSTVALHMAVALLHAGARVAVIDLDLRQATLDHFFDNRAVWLAANSAQAPQPTVLRMPRDVDEATLLAAFDAALAEAAAGHDLVIIDTPGGDTAVSRAAHGRSDLIVTPMNDSFVDFDLIGEVDPLTLEVTKPSLYAATVWEARKQRMMAAARQRTRASIDWVVLRNRLAVTEARNRKRLEERMQALSRRAGYRLGPGLRDRVIYRELFPFGLTVSDLSSKIRPVSVSISHVAAKQELRALMQSLGLAEGGEDTALTAAA